MQVSVFIDKTCVTSFHMQLKEVCVICKLLSTDGLAQKLCVLEL